MQLGGAKVGVGRIMFVEPPYVGILKEHTATTIRLQPMFVRINHQRIDLIKRGIGGPCLIS